MDGYEIHMGVSRDGSGNSRIECSKDNVYGTYLHGFFDEAAPVEALAAYLAKEKGLPEPTEHLVSHRAYKEAQYDLLADALRAHLDMDRIYEIIGIKA